MSSTEAPFSFTTKVNGDLLTVRGESVSQFIDRLRELANEPDIEEAIGSLQSLGAVATAVSTLGATVVEVRPAPDASAPEKVTDKYGGEWTYNHPDAPDLSDGRGKYALHSWRSKAGKDLKAWKDPSKGPKPFSPGAEEAQIIWA